MYFYVMQVIKGQTVAHGPYKSEDAMKNRYERVKGGEVYMYRTFEEIPEKAIQEFKVEGV